MNLNLMNMCNRVRKPKRIPYDVFSKSLQDKLIELGYKKKNKLSRFYYSLFYANKKAHIVPEYYDYFYIEPYYENIGFANDIESNPCGCWHGYCSPEDFTKENLDILIEKATNYALNSKKCVVQSKLNDIEKDFE